MIRAVLDTNILVAGLRSRQGASFQILTRVAAREIRPLVTIALFLEYEAVLKRPEHCREHGFAPHELDDFLAGFATLAEPVDVHYMWRPQLSDPSDELVLEAMVNGRGDVLLTHNLRDFAKAAGRFGIAIKSPGDFLKDRKS